LKDGFDADIVVFDPKNITDNASYSSPKEYPMGIVYVMINGEVTVKKGGHSGAQSGRILGGKGRP